MKFLNLKMALVLSSMALGSSMLALSDDVDWNRFFSSAKPFSSLNEPIFYYYDSVDGKMVPVRVPAKRYVAPQTSSQECEQNSEKKPFVLSNDDLLKYPACEMDEKLYQTAKSVLLYHQNKPNAKQENLETAQRNVEHHFEMLERCIKEEKEEELKRADRKPYVLPNDDLPKYPACEMDEKLFQGAKKILLFHQNKPDAKQKNLDAAQGSVELHFWMLERCVKEQQKAAQNK